MKVPNNSAPSFYLLFRSDLSGAVNLCYNYGMIWDGSSSVPTHFYAVCLSVNLNDKLSTFIEGYGYFNQTAKPEFYLDAGFAYLITDHLQADITAAGYLNSNILPLLYLLVNGQLSNMQIQHLNKILVLPSD